MTIISRIHGFIKIKNSYGFKTALKTTLNVLRGLSVQDALHASHVHPVILLQSNSDGLKGINYFQMHNQWLNTHADKLSSSFSHQLFSKRKIVIIGDLNLAQCKKYRVMQKFEAFKNQGIDVEFCHWLDEPRALNMLQCATHIIFYRVLQHLITQAYLDEARRLNVKVIYDLDDPIFHRVIYSRNKGLDFIPAYEKRSLLESSNNYSQFIKKCDTLIASTPGLKNLMEETFNKPVFLWRNLVDAQTLSAVTRALQTKEGPVETRDISKSFTLGYMSGSRAHEANFKFASKQIANIMKAYSHVSLKVVGHLQLPCELMSFKSRIKQIGFTDYDIYIKELSTVDLNLIPLCIDDFNNCKSAIRYLESALVKVPTIVSKVGDFCNIIYPNKTGVLIENENDWYPAIKSFIENPKKITDIGTAAHIQVMENYLLSETPDALKNVFEMDQVK